MRFPRKTTALLSCAALAIGVAACGDDSDDSSASTSSGGASTAAATADLSGQIAGAGASSQAAAAEAWIAGFQEANSGVTVSYDPIGSGGGREQFIAGGTAFAGTDSALDAEELRAAARQCTNVVEVPVYISPIAIIYNLPGVEELRLSPATAAAMLLGEIRNWNDPAIARENPDVELPDTAVTPVHRSDESGTTENLAEYLSTVAPDVWRAEVSGDWPTRSGESADGTSGVVEAVSAGEGTIGYADASQAGDLGVALLQVGEEFVGPTPEAAAAILEESRRVEGEGDYVFAYDLRRDTTATGTYPAVLVSYGVACTHYDDANTGAIVRAYMSYLISPEGQETAASAAGSAPLSDALRTELQPAVDAIGAR
ncbi:phosphate ABC transporter substrate-binding protein PstS [Conexibacter stalactiti]|uniref:Phosphate-binding protein n=1 Tax=Conexibacter stalactiti TaxID=1940611 RepID=A0ABU4HIS6_9ACTN|nr:phosphate ABC transporter substrate-binding protein PstS [Conexibacter stalactiti]MDW5593208.1 phosphate ABC transporter substrate-binding protein PstS [Conexibacter stalactiti]MEC5033849.1 phosphate ABC transporter substrate-binding protein PstS [Conexibacter stalactiti]